MDEVLYSRRADCMWRRTLDGVLALASQADAPVHIGGSGALAWGLLSEPLTLRELIIGLADAYSLPPESLFEDITELVDRLVQLGVLVREPRRPVTSA